MEMRPACPGHARKNEDFNMQKTITQTGPPRNRVRSISVKDQHSGAARTIHASYFLDATEQGDLLPLTGAEYVTGFESRKQTGEQPTGIRKAA